MSNEPRSPNDPSDPSEPEDAQTESPELEDHPEPTDDDIVDVEAEPVETPADAPASGADDEAKPAAKKGLLGFILPALIGGLALAIVIDASIVRMVLVPASMKLMGEWNWWAPAPLRRIHERFGLHEPPSAAGDFETLADLPWDGTGEREPAHSG